MKLCLFCKEWYLDGGMDGYSEDTPGNAGSMLCLKKCFKEMDLEMVSMDEFRDVLKTAESCKCYNPVKD